MFDSIRKLIRKMRGQSRPWYRSGAIYQPVNVGLSQSVGTSIDNSYSSFVQNVSEQYKKAIVKDERIEKKPVEVVNELITDKPVMDLTDLKRKIKVVERRMRILKEQGVGDNGDDGRALGYLKARLKYDKYKHLFIWHLTTQEKIDALCRKYKLKVVDFAGYTRNVPTEALDEVERYNDAYEKVRQDVAPVLKLIIDEGGKETKKDPILLASSPFGNWWHIEGAWDKEVEYVDELIYKGK